MGREIPRSRARSMADDPCVKSFFWNHLHDDDAELFTYPDCIDQRHIGDAATGWAGAFADDDMEMDDGV